MEIRPFRLIHYPFDAGLLSKVVCPPYDKVTDADIESLKARHPTNYVNAIIGDNLHDHGYYEKAAATLRGWVADGTLQQEESEKILVYRQKYVDPLTGDNRTRSGFYALLRLPEREDNAVLPHERTFAEHKADRLRLYHAVKGNPEAIFVLYSDPQGKVRSVLDSAQGLVSFVDFAGQENELGLLDSPEAIQALKEVVEVQKLLIADGHHRFETGQNYRDERRAETGNRTGDEPFEFILVYFAALEDPGLVILPTHRAVKHIPEDQLNELLIHARDFFDVEEHTGTATPVSLSETALQLNRAEKDTMAVVTRTRTARLALRDREKLRTLLASEVAEPLRDLPVVWLHRVLFDRFLGVGGEEDAPDRIAYVRTGQDVFDCLEGGYDVGFLMRGTRPAEVKLAAEGGHRMPQKSTDFYPKVLSGIAAYLHD